MSVFVFVSNFRWFCLTPCHIQSQLDSDQICGFRQPTTQVYSLSLFRHRQRDISSVSFGRGKRATAIPPGAITRSHHQRRIYFILPWCCWNQEIRATIITHFLHPNISAMLFYNSRYHGIQQPQNPAPNRAYSLLFHHGYGGQFPQGRLVVFQRMDQGVT